MARAKKAIAKREATLPAAVTEQLAMSAGAGLASDVDDYALPFLRIAQKMSPVVDKQDGEYIAECDVGDIYNTVTRELWSGEEGILVVPVLVRTDFLVWRPNRGGFVGSFSKAEGVQMLANCSRDERNNDILPDGNILSRTGSTFVMQVDPETHECSPAVIAMSSTQYKYWRRWNSMMQTVKLLRAGSRISAPAFAAGYRLNTFREENEHGTWNSWEPKFAGLVEGLFGKSDMSECPSLILNESVLQACVDFNQTVSAGEAKVNYEQMGDEQAADANANVDVAEEVM